jgi:hypothetical protein
MRPIDGVGEARAITTDRVRPGGVALVSPDGRSIAYPSFDDQNRPAIKVCDVEACASKRTFPFALAMWTPDSRGLAYLDPRLSDVWIQPIDGGTPRQLTHFPEDGQQIWGGAFAADGRLAIGRAAIKNNIVLFRGLKGPGR